VGTGVLATEKCGPDNDFELSLVAIDDVRHQEWQRSFVLRDRPIPSQAKPPGTIDLTTMTLTVMLHESLCRPSRTG
jgi:hypothetical protein